MSTLSRDLYSKLEKSKLFNKKIVFGLKRIKLVLKKLKNPEQKLQKVIQIIGSDGKFSLLTSLKYFIEANGQTVSAHVSPSLVSIRERFWLGKRYISYKEIKKSIKKIERLKIPLSVYEVLTVIFFLNAYKKKNDFVIQEAGALWAKDSNNVIKDPLAQCIVNINKQHLNFVKKKTLNEIIRQKVGFLSKNTRIYVGKQKPSTLKKIKSYLRKNPSKKIYYKDWKLKITNKHFFYKDKKNKIKIRTKNIKSLALINNLCMAIKIALDLGVKKQVIEKTIPKIEIVGRVQYIKKGKFKKILNKKEELLIDGCHSKKSAENLYSYLKTLKKPIYGIWGMQKNKMPKEFIKSFKGIFKKIVTITIPENSNALSASELKKISDKNRYKTEIALSIKDAIKKCSSKKKKIIVIFGSLYLVGNFLEQN